MPAPTNTEQILELRDRIAEFETELTKLNILFKEQLRHFEQTLGVHGTVVSHYQERLAQQETQIAVLREQLKTLEAQLTTQNSVLREQLKTVEAQLLLKNEQTRNASVEKHTATEERLKYLELKRAWNWQAWLAVISFLMSASLTVTLFFFKK